MASPAFDYIARLFGTPQRRSALFGVIVLGLLAYGVVAAQPLARVSPAARLANSAFAPGAGAESVLDAGRTTSEDMSAELGAQAAAMAASVPGDENWQELFGVKQAATDGDIFAMVNNGSEIYIAGSFTSIGGVRANHVARWDGKSWNRLGDSAVNGVNANAYALAISGDTIYVGGEFSTAGGAAASRVARFVKTSGQWSALGAGVTGAAPVYVGALLYDRGLLYVGGNFTSAGGQTASSVARWNAKAASWSSLGSGSGEGVNGEIYAMTISGDAIYVGGNFSRAGSASANNVAAWSTTGNSWSALGQGVRGYVNALTVWKNQVTAGGDFSLDSLNNVGLGTYDGTAWRALTAQLGQPGEYSDAPAASKPGGVVRSLVANGPILYVGGAFRAVSPTSFSNAAIAANFIVKWNGTALNTAFESISSTTGNGTTGPVNAIMLNNGNLYVAGAFRSAGGINANRIALYDGRKWQPLGEERFETQNVYAVLVNGNDIYIGRPENAYGQGSIAKWNGSGWNTLGLTSGSVYALAISGDELFVGGHFSSVEGTSAVNIARFNLTTKKWSAFGEGSGVGGGSYSAVQALAVRGSDLYVGGRFLIADTIAATDLAIYNPTSGWRALGSGIEGADFNIIYSIALAQNGDVYVGGRFTRAGGIATNNIAKFSNGTWSALGTGLGGAVNAIALVGEKVFAGGDFTTAGDAPALRVASWDGTSWSPMGGGVSGGPLPIVYGMVSNGNNVYVAGLFRKVGSDSVARIVRWSTVTNSWQKLGSGVDNTVRAVAFSNGILHVVGEFGYAGGKTSPTYAQWSSVADGKAVRDGHDRGQIELGQNYPNPFNPTTVIRFQLGQSGFATLRVFDLSGNEVRRLVEGDLPAGEHEVIFDGTDLGSGMYFYQLKSGALIETRKLLLSK